MSEDAKGKPMAGFQHRQSPASGPEDFPTPPWAARALIEKVLRPHHFISPQEKNPLTVWEPAANRGYMARPLAETFGTVIATDLHDYGMGYPKIDFLTGPDPREFGMPVDWIITNPPFNMAEQFILRALDVAAHGVAMFCRTAFIETHGRYQSIFSKQPPTVMAQFVERVPLVQGRVDAQASTAMPYAWFVWDQRVDGDGETRLMWIAPTRKALERDGDYDEHGTMPMWEKEEQSDE